ncbi:exosome complex exonuclease rrp44 isoform 1 [Lichtheimia corymbifera JMRC:FSU:9682]|uniref:Ribosomal RNA-processing protein 44 n=1 Tax=Lichtheimia corymbifera JMRC:FSU:9682 TaxID=1263082 RepID=A0A068SDC9_9FUNG|nr:exosome complex exonuclease rrp44 isoform 1 [Lichtheimia corymbifera JMRC:FSU:9682]
MLRSKAFVKRTRKGNVVKVVKEHYLRDDITCSSAACNACEQQSLPILSANPRKSELTDRPHYIIPDTNVFMNQLDIMEHPSIKDVIVLQTVREELRHLSLAVYNRLNAILADKNRRFYLFANEHHRDTFLEKLKDETPNDRNDRAIRVGTQWYANHLKESGILTIMLSDDRANREKAASMGVKSQSVRDYVRGMKDVPELLDMLAAPKSETTETDKIVFEEHLSPAHIANGMKKGTLIQGSLNVSQHNVLEATIVGNVDGEPKTIYILGRKNMNRSIQGDIVAVELLPRDQWKKSTSIAVEDEEDEEKMHGEMDTVMTEANAMDKDEVGEPTGKVVGLIRKRWRPYCGFIVKNSVHSSEGSTAAERVIFRALDRRIPPIKIKTTQAHSLLGNRIVVSIDSWPVNSVHPMGHFVKTLGSSGDKETETEVLLLEHDVPYQEFSKRVLDDLPAEGDDWVVTEKHLTTENRRDLRHLNICSIDPPGCTDIDDALHVRPLENGNYEIGVHIADVTYFVKPGQAMDTEAANRGTTVYLVDKRIDMLPALLGTNLCSLRSNVERLAFSCIWELTKDAEIVKVDFTKSVIRSKHSFTYDEAQSRIDDERMQDDVTKGIRILNELAKKLRKKRIERGALTLSSPEVRFNLENDSQDPVDVEMKELKETNALVEEFMLLANISVAQKIFSHFPMSALLRKHGAPPVNNFDTLRKALGEVGITLNVESSKALADSLDAAVLPNDAYFNKLVRIMTTRCMMQAQYFCSGTESEAEFRHYGLATPIYTHFTSPIRRYSDVIVHRLLQASIDPDVAYGQELTDKTKMKELCDVLNHRHRMAQMAGRSSVELYTNMFFKNKTLVEEGRVIRILKNGFVVLVPRFGIESIVYTSKGPDEPSVFIYDEEKNALIAGDVIIKMFDTVKVEIKVEGDETGMRQKMRMSLVYPQVPGLEPSDQSSKKRKAQETKNGSQNTKRQAKAKIAA